MNRRDFAKGLAALPLVGDVKSFASICGSTPCPSKAGSLRVILEGAFALLINRSSPWGIRVFTPKHHGEHAFVFNTLPCDKDSKYKFELSPLGLKPASSAPCIDSTFQYFCAEQTPCNPSTKHHFITIDLPGPERILSLSSSGVTATMEDGNEYPLPGDHILEYEITNSSLIQMSGWYNDKLVTPPLRPYTADGYTVFKFEVGLPRLLGGGDSDLKGEHAVEFYNRGVLPYFSKLKDSSRWKMQKVKGAYKTTTLECKNGGIIGTSP